MVVSEPPEDIDCLYLVHNEFLKMADSNYVYINEAGVCWVQPLKSMSCYILQSVKMTLYACFVVYHYLSLRSQ